MRSARLGRAAAVIAMAAVAVVGVATPASAHSQLQSSAPASSATVTTSLSEVTLTFDEQVRGKFSTVVVRDGSGRSWSRGAVQVVDDAVHQPVYPLRSGAYTVAWRVVSADGHPVEGEYGFTVSLPAALEPSSGPPSTPPVVPPAGRGGLWIAILLLVAAAATLPLIRALRRHRREPDEP